MAKFYESIEFKALNEVWRAKLRASEFIDIENPKEKLKEFDRRTKSWDNRIEILSFHLCFNEYLLHADLPLIQKKALTLYSEGIQQKTIATQVGKSYRWVKYLIAHHKKEVCALFPDEYGAYQDT